MMYDTAVQDTEPNSVVTASIEIGSKVIPFTIFFLANHIELIYKEHAI